LALLACFHAAARIPVAKRLQVFGPSDRALSRAVEEEGVHLLGVQVRVCVCREEVVMGSMAEQTWS
jgi:hypothetical protein